MTKALAAILLVIAGCLLATRCVKIQPQSPLVHTQKMAGAHSFSGTETDHLLPVYPNYTPAHDTSYTVSYALNFYFQNDATIYVNTENSYAPGTLELGTFQVTAYDAAAQVFTYTYTDTCCNMTTLDTLLYDFPNNTITIHQHFTNPDGVYVVNMRTP